MRRNTIADLNALSTASVVPPMDLAKSSSAIDRAGGEEDAANVIGSGASMPGNNLNGNGFF